MATRQLANLPRRYVSRERLCLRGTTDYWVNDAVGRPFFVVSKPVTDGLAHTLLEDIVPLLLQSVPLQPTAGELTAEPLLHRFVVFFDRDGATHSLLGQLWQQRIGVVTYRKNVKDAWAEAEFSEQEVAAPGGGTTRMTLALRQIQLGAGKTSTPVSEVRRLTETGHQTAIITTAQHLGTTLIAGRMFSRWCQEGCFAYMMQHYHWMDLSSTAPTPKKVRLDRLPEEQRPNALRPLGKMLADAVKMIAYRAETAMVVLLRRHLATEAEARALVRELICALV